MQLTIKGGKRDVEQEVTCAMTQERVHVLGGRVWPAGVWKAGETTGKLTALLGDGLQCQGTGTGRPPCVQCYPLTNFQGKEGMARRTWGE